VKTQNCEGRAPLWAVAAAAAAAAAAAGGCFKFQFTFHKVLL